MRPSEGQAVVADDAAAERGQRRPRDMVFGASAGFLAQIVSVAAYAVTGVVIARVVGPSGTGTYALLSNFNSTVGLVAGVGLSTGIAIEVGRGEWSTQSALRTVVLIALPLGVGGALLGLAFYFATGSAVFKSVSLGLVAAPLLSVPFLLATWLIGSVAVAKKLYSKFAVSTAAAPVFTCLGVFALTIPFGLTGAVVAAALGSVFSAVVAIVLVRREGARADTWPLGAPVRSWYSHLQGALSLGVRSWGGDLLQFLNYRADLFIVAAFTTRYSLSQYSVAVSLTGLGWLLPNAVASVFLPRAASLEALAARGEVPPEAPTAASARMLRHAVLGQVPTALALLALVALIPPIFGSRFQPAVNLGLIFIPGVTILGVGKIAMTAVNGKGFTIYTLYVALVTAPVTMLLYFTLIPSLGATGGAIASSISYALTTVLAIYFFARAGVAPLRSALVPGKSELRDYVQIARRMVRR